MAKNIDSTFTETLTGWYRENRRDLPWRQDRDPYHVWVSEIMLQQTRVEAVRDYYKRFMDALPEIADLAAADEEVLLKLWQGLGYYNRVRNMHKAAVCIMEEHGGAFPQDYAEIRELPGIGDYTAGAIASICFDQRTAAVDGNVLRVITRLTEDESDTRSAAVKKRITAYLSQLYPQTDCGDFTQGLIELGALVCVPAGQPKCGICPVQSWCGACESGRTADFPVKIEKKARRRVEKTVFFLQKGDMVAVRRRPAEGLLGGLYEFPNVDIPLDASGAVAQAESWGCRPRNLLRSSSHKHIFTHVEWDMTGYYMDVEHCCPQFQWVSREQLEKEIPLPSAFAWWK
ncbi:MAG: A/G-specific adenine glycosylase [Emergencia sp.]